MVATEEKVTTETTEITEITETTETTEITEMPQTTVVERRRDEMVTVPIAIGEANDGLQDTKVI